MFGSTFCEKKHCREQQLEKTFVKKIKSVTYTILVDTYVCLFSYRGFIHARGTRSRQASSRTLYFCGF
jgi:hypothetical protein